MIYLIVGLLIGAALVWFLEKSKRDLVVRDYENQLKSLRELHEKEVQTLSQAEKKIK
jgi:hypothetical protein